MRIQGNAPDAKAPAETSRFDRAMASETQGKKGQRAEGGQRGGKSASKNSRTASGEAAGRSFGKKTAGGQSADGKGAAGEGGVSKSTAFTKSAAVLKSAGAQIQSQVQTQLQSLKSALASATGIGQPQAAASKGEGAKSAQTGAGGAGTAERPAAASAPNTATTNTAARTGGGGAETAITPDTGGRANVANAETISNTAPRAAPTESAQQSEARTQAEFIEAQADPNGLLAANPHGLMVHGGGQGQAVPMVLYRLGENAVGADMVIINADGTGMIMGDGIEVALNGGDFDAEGNWIAAEGHGVVDGQPVDLIPNDDGDVFIAIGDGTSALHVNARMSDGAELSADVVAVERV